ncbi:MAG: TIGR03435 family protein, partial [Candidatus Solibacter sp.]|nr:TIGR03435 family protein [Candidatus Solibacter sp.]
MWPFKLMLQDLLAERFKLVLHHETKELPMYALVVGKGGSKLKESVDDGAAASGGSAQGGAAGSGGPSASAPTPPPPPPGSDGAGPVRLRIGADGVPQLPPGAMRGGLMMMMGNGRMNLVGNGQPIAALVEMLGNQMGRPVVDATDLKAKYDLKLDFAPEGMNGPMGMMPPPPGHEGGPGGAPMASTPDNAGPSIFTAL